MDFHDVNFMRLIFIYKIYLILIMNIFMYAKKWDKSKNKIY